ncbi:MAG: hypothetical protein ACLURV_11960 [Gallintestinimicrobium sp.]
MKSTAKCSASHPPCGKHSAKDWSGGHQLTDKGGIFITVRDTDKDEIPDIAQRFADLGFHLYATAGTAAVLRDHGMSVTLVHKISESEHNTIALLESGKVNYIISTSKKGRTPARDSVKVRRKSVELGIPCLTSLDTAVAPGGYLKERLYAGYGRAGRYLHAAKVKGACGAFLSYGNEVSYTIKKARSTASIPLLCSGLFFSIFSTSAMALRRHSSICSL